MKRYRRLLTATDFSEVSEVAAAEAAGLADHYKAELTFLHVVEHFPEHLPHYRIAHEDMDPQEFLIDRAKKDLQSLCKKVGKANAKQEVVVTAHSAKSEILKFIKENDIDLIVLGGRGRHTLMDMLGGSTATGVVRATTCDVFVVHGPG